MEDEALQWVAWGLSQNRSLRMLDLSGAPHAPTLRPTPPRPLITPNPAITVVHMKIICKFRSWDWKPQREPYLLRTGKILHLGCLLGVHFVILELELESHGC